MPTTLIEVTKQQKVDGSGSIRNNSASETDNYKVYFSADDATATDARNATGVPPYGAQLTTATLGTVNLYVSEKQATREIADGRIWDVTVTYTTPDPNSQPAKPSGFTSGDKYGVQVSMQAVAIEEAITVDTSNKPIVNVNNEPINPQLVQLIYDQKLTVTFWTDQIDQSAIDACIGKANSEVVEMTIGADTWIFAANTLKFDDYSWTVNYDADGNMTIQVTLNFMYRADTWTVKVPNRSLYYMNATYGMLVPITDDNNQKVSEPRYLDADGAVIPQGDDIYYLSFDVVYLVDFATLLAGVP